jgi:hypothetical protein
MVLVDEQHGLDSVAAAVAAGGARVDRVMQGMKTIICSVDDDAVIERVRRMVGVTSVREEGTFSVPPMDHDIPL